MGGRVFGSLLAFSKCGADFKIWNRISSPPLVDELEDPNLITSLPREDSEKKLRTTMNGVRKCASKRALNGRLDNPVGPGAASKLCAVVQSSIHD